jgi:plastocyanin
MIAVLGGFLALTGMSPIAAKQWTVQVGGTSGYGGGYGGGYGNPVLAFSPAQLTINASDSVTFVNLGGAAHNVHADDGSFRCANGCDGQGGNGDPSTADWTFTLTFATPGTIRYHCDNHVSMGMVGSIVVQAASGSPPLGGYLSGNWYGGPSQSGHGFQLEFTSQNNTAVAIWFVYSPDGAAQNWIYAQGPYDPTQSSVTLQAFLLTGGKFPNPPSNFDPNAVQKTSWGTLSFQFSDCNNGTASWASTLPGYGSGSLPIQRISQIAGTTCPP